MTDRIMARASAVLAVGLLIVLAACAGPRSKLFDIDEATLGDEAMAQRIVVMTELSNQLRRLERIGYPILAAATALCTEDIRPTLGMGYWNQFSFDDFGKDPEGGLFANDERALWRVAAREGMGLREQVHIRHVYPNSPAAKAGLQSMDMVIEVDNWSVPSGEDGVEALEARLRETLTQDQQPVTLRIFRGNADIRRILVAEPACDYAIDVELDDVVNAFADGERTFFTTAMMRFVNTDDELALIVGHEIAHNAMEHRSAKTTNVAVGSGIGLVFDILAAVAGVNTQGAFSKAGGKAGAGAFSQGFEAEADYVGLYAVARAGYQRGDAPNLWRRMSVLGTDQIIYGSSHPSNSYRAAALQKTIEEIQIKRERGEALVPNLEKEWSAPKRAEGESAFTRGAATE